MCACPHQPPYLSCISELSSRVGASVEEIEAFRRAAQGSEMRALQARPPAKLQSILGLWLWPFTTEEALTQLFLER